MRVEIAADPLQLLRFDLSFVGRLGRYSRDDAKAEGGGPDHHVSLAADADVNNGVVSRKAAIPRQFGKICPSGSDPIADIRRLCSSGPMDLGEAGEWAAVAVMIAALLLFPRWFSFRSRAIAGAILFPLGWAAVLGGLHLGDRPFMQSEVVVFIWTGLSAFALVLAITLLVPVFFEWRKKRRKPPRTVERWRAGHWKN